MNWPTWFLPRAKRKLIEESELMAQALKRNRTYAQDTLSAADLDQAKTWEAQYATLLKTRDLDGLTALNKEVQRKGRKIFPPSPWEDWRENVEVYVVAGIMALAIRTFFLQPFQIPTGSMEPTLYGIEPMVENQPPPNFFYRVYDFVIHGRSYSHVVTQQGGRITDLESGHFTLWFEYTTVTLTNDAGQVETDTIWLRRSDVASKVGLELGKTYLPGDALINVVIQTGDKVLVDKVTYNFRNPRVGDVIIFETDGIPFLDRQHNPADGGGEVYIKRCLGRGGDTVTVDPPRVLLNGQPVSGSSVFAKQFAQTDHYPGYSFANMDNFPVDSAKQTQSFPTLPLGTYWAMGDNSPNSQDSRYFGPVPHKNFVGRGCFVFWPFTERWGFMP